jgi:probable H4MPT-linked C1 transfer pathway protein
VVKNNSVIGWDIGGAHLKAVLRDATGKVLAAKQVYCPLWRGLNELATAIDDVLLEMQATQHAVTMTGELADIFCNRQAGVVKIAQLAAKKLTGEVRFFAGNAGFVPLNLVEHHAHDIASMNWLASLQYLAQQVKQALFVDIGSTTTDLAILHSHAPQVLGFNDAARLKTDELVYTGVVRTPLMALAQKIPFNGDWVNVAAEHFATTADVYTLTGELPLHDNMSDTADHAEKSMEASARRIARMVGMDATDAPLIAWRRLAHSFKTAQLNQLQLAMLRQISRLQDQQSLQVIGCGAGEFLAAELAQRLGLQFVSVTHYVSAENEKLTSSAAVCFPAFAVAGLGLAC